jgi:hypothetical protein
MITTERKMTNAQLEALEALAKRYGVPFDRARFEYGPFDLPPGYVAGWVGPIYVGCSPEGRISS